MVHTHTHTHAPTLTHRLKHFCFADGFRSTNGRSFFHFPTNRAFPSTLFQDALTPPLLSFLVSSPWLITSNPNRIITSIAKPPNAWSVLLIRVHALSDRQQKQTHKQFTQLKHPPTGKHNALWIYILNLKREREREREESVTKFGRFRFLMENA